MKSLSVFAKDVVESVYSTASDIYDKTQFIGQDHRRRVDFRETLKKIFNPSFTYLKFSDGQEQILDTRVDSQLSLLADYANFSWDSVRACREIGGKEAEALRASWDGHWQNFGYSKTAVA